MMTTTRANEAASNKLMHMKESKKACNVRKKLQSDVRTGSARLIFQKNIFCIFRSTTDGLERITRGTNETWCSLSWDLTSIFPNLEMCITANRRVGRRLAIYNIECAGSLAVREIK